MKHFATPRFWFSYRHLSQNVRDLADKNFQMLKTDARHPSLHLKPIGEFWSVRVGLAHRALGVTCEGGIDWFWIGSHADYTRLLAGK